MAVNREEYKSESITFFTFPINFRAFSRGRDVKMRYPVSGVRRKHLYLCLSTRLAFEDSSPPLFCAYDFSGGFLSPFREERVPSRRRLVAERSESLLICGDGDCPTPHCAKQSLPDPGEKGEAPPRHVSGFTPDFVPLACNEGSKRDVNC